VVAQRDGWVCLVGHRPFPPVLTESQRP
jgi:hypothetical protein